MDAPSRKPVLLLHVGMHKTGTTSLQARCQEHSAELRSHGLLYPAAGQSDLYPNHNQIAKNLLGDTRGTGRQGALGEILEEIEASRCERVLVSGEDLSRLWQRPDLLERLRSSFESLGYEVHVLLGCRQPESFVPALYGTLVRQGMGVERSQFEREARETGQVTVPALVNWPRRVFCTEPVELEQAFADAFGPDRMHVVDYDASGMITKIIETQAWFFGDQASLLSDVGRQNTSGDLDGRRRLEDLLADLQGSTVWRSTRWVRTPTARRIRTRARSVAGRLSRTPLSLGQWRASQTAVNGEGDEARP